MANVVPRRLNVLVSPVVPTQYLSLRSQSQDYGVSPQDRLERRIELTRQEAGRAPLRDSERLLLQQRALQKRAGTGPGCPHHQR